MADQPLPSRVFNLNDQVAFARLSSDWNPVHLDPAFARRSQFGAPIVHGIHSLAWAANTVLHCSPRKLASIHARFLQPLYLDEPAFVRIRNRSDSRIELEIVAADTVAAQFRLSSEPGKSAAQSARPTPSAPAKISQPADLRFEQLAGRTGAVAIGDGDVRSSFPALTESIGLSAVKALLATSQIVGMACPGLYSLFSGLDVDCDPASAGENALAYAVSKVDARFRSLQIAVSGCGIAGRLDAFARPAPPTQPGSAEISPHVAGSPFSGQKSLIIGGSRGIGEVTAKIVAAGGGRCVITYRDSQHEAERVSAEILEAGGQCETLRYDALLPASEQLKQLGAVDCCYYFATSRIFQRKSALYEQEKLRRFLSFYADGFFDLCATLNGSGRVAVFYPSTVAIDEGVSATAEYAMAKVAGEVLAKYVNEFMSNIHVTCRRLPRILTDQTAVVGVASADNVLDVMLPIVYDVQQMARSDLASRG
jgi:NAD(P)-dependent dehydrogenase (short-subunit alcohol dehydrogenase family)